MPQEPAVIEEKIRMPFIVKGPVEFADGKARQYSIIPGFESYCVCDDGSIWRTRARGNSLKQPYDPEVFLPLKEWIRIKTFKCNKKGPHHYVGLYGNFLGLSVCQNISVGKLMFLAFGHRGPYQIQPGWGRLGAEEAQARWEQIQNRKIDRSMKGFAQAVANPKKGKESTDEPSPDKSDVL